MCGECLPMPGRCVFFSFGVRGSLEHTEAMVQHEVTKRFQVVDVTHMRDSFIGKPRCVVVDEDIESRRELLTI